MQKRARGEGLLWRSRTQQEALDMAGEKRQNIAQEEEGGEKTSGQNFPLHSFAQGWACPMPSWCCTNLLNQ